jgi:hypothetical protein
MASEYDAVESQRQLRHSNPINGRSQLKSSSTVVSTVAHTDGGKMVVIVWDSNSKRGPRKRQQQSRVSQPPMRLTAVPTSEEGL